MPHHPLPALALLVASAVAGSLVAQSPTTTALVASYAQPDGADGPVTFTHRGQPVVGGTLPRFVVDDGTAGATGALLLGSSVVAIPVTPLGVTLFTVPLGSVPFSLDAVGKADLDLLPGVPLSTSLTGLQLVAQSAVLDPRAATGLFVTDAVQMQFGEAFEQPTFGGRRFLAGEAPLGLDAGDLNGDGIPDLVVSEGNGTGFSSFLGDGRGGFAQTYSSATGASPGPTRLADLDADGALDCVIVNSNGSSVSLFFGDGDGTFTRAPDLTVASPRDIEVADVTGDGIADLLVTSSSPSELLVFVGDGNGGFTALPGVPAVIALPHSLEVGDLNADGALDVVLLPGNGTPDNRMIIMLNDGTGSFGPSPAGAFASGIASVSQGTLADVDGDQDLDVVLGGPFDGNIGVHVNDGNAGFSGPVVTNVLVSPGIATRAANAADVTSADFDGDGVPDLAIASSRSDEVLVMFGRGDGSFDQGPFLGTGDLPATVITLDANQDGEMDLIAANLSTDDFTIFLGAGEGSFDGPTIAEVGRGTVDLDVAELTGDTQPDVVTADLFAGTLTVLPTAATGGFAAALSIVTGGNPTAVVARDVDGDFRNDLVYVDQQGHTLGVCRSLGQGMFAPAERFATGQDGAPIGVALGDIDGDGTVDALVANRAIHSLGRLLGNGDGTFGELQQIPLGAGMQPRDVQIADLDNDGALDLATVTDPGGQLIVALGQGDGTFGPLERITIGGNPEDLAIGDLDDDGVLDIAVAAGGAGAQILFGRGDGTFEPPTNPGPGSTVSVFSVSIGDLDGDGRSDLGALDTVTQCVHVFRNSGSGGSMLAAERYSIAILTTRFSTGVASSLVLRDIDGDQQVDLVTSVSLGVAGGVVSTSLSRRPSLIDP